MIQVSIFNKANGTNATEQEAKAVSTRMGGDGTVEIEDEGVYLISVSDRVIAKLQRDGYIERNIKLGAFLPTFEIYAEMP